MAEQATADDRAAYQFLAEWNAAALERATAKGIVCAWPSCPVHGNCASRG